MLVVDQSELIGLLRELESAIVELRQNPHVEKAQCDVCLLTRSTFTEFFSVSELEGEVIEAPASQLQIHFMTILRLMPDGVYKESVSERYNDFRDYCKEMANQRDDDTDLSFE